MRIQKILIAILILNYGCSDSKKMSISFSDEPVTSPELFAPGLISTNESDEFDLCFTPDGQTVYFTRRVADKKQKIYQAEYENGNWSPAEIASFSTDRDETPYITPDGNKFYFGSQREIPGKPNKGGFDMNVWMMQKEGTGWSAPEPLPEPINYVQIEGENWPSSNNNFFFTLDGETYYFTTMIRNTKTIEIYKTRSDKGEFSKPERIEGLFENDSLWKYSASISPDGLFMVFNSYQAPGGRGGEDLY
ncbi:MAG: hypothetical protein HKO94_03695, partial [Flavobacteriaceae bacterium]|nr:hypothetical protein [Flavobacteriaceae bacterium]